MKTIEEKLKEKIQHSRRLENENESLLKEMERINEEHLEKLSEEETKFSQTNGKLKRLIQTLREAIDKFVDEERDLWTNIGEETIDRLEHLFSTIRNLNRQIVWLKSEKEKSEEFLKSQICQLEKFVENDRTILSNRRNFRFVFSSLVSADRSEEIVELRRTLTENGEQQSFLREKLNETENELRKSVEENRSALNRIEMLKKENFQQIEEILSEKKTL